MFLLESWFFATASLLFQSLNYQPIGDNNNNQAGLL
jgi:hypothetical protein